MNRPASLHSDFIERGEGVYYPKDPLVVVTPEHIELLKQAAMTASKKRARICGHPRAESALHEMLIALSRHTYVRPHKHLGKPESFHLIEGCADALFFDDKGNLSKVLAMSSAGINYYRTEQESFHSLVIRSEFLVFHEVTSGPFKPAETLFAEWSPAEGLPDEIQRYKQKLELDIEAFKKALLQESPKVAGNTHK